MLYRLITTTNQETHRSPHTLMAWYETDHPVAEAVSTRQWLLDFRSCWVYDSGSKNNAWWWSMMVHNGWLLNVNSGLTRSTAGSYRVPRHGTLQGKPRGLRFVLGSHEHKNNWMIRAPCTPCSLPWRTCFPSHMSLWRTSPKLGVIRTIRHG